MDAQAQKQLEKDIHNLDKVTSGKKKEVQD